MNRTELIYHCAEKLHRDGGYLPDPLRMAEIVINEVIEQIQRGSFGVDQNPESAAQAQMRAYSMRDDAIRAILREPIAPEMPFPEWVSQVTSTWNINEPIVELEDRVHEDIS